METHKSLITELAQADLADITDSAEKFLESKLSTLEHDYQLSVNLIEDFGGYPARYIDFFPVGRHFAADHKKFGGIFVRAWVFGNPKLVVTGIFMGAERAEQSEPRRGVSFIRNLLEPDLTAFEDHFGFNYHVWGTPNFEWAKKSSRALARQLEQFASFREDILENDPSAVEISLSAALNFLDGKLNTLIPVERWANEIISLYYGENIPTKKVHAADEGTHLEIQLGSALLMQSCALLSKRFLIFTGLSGSGKSRAAKQVAQAFSEDSSHYHFAAVGPDWNNRDPLLGYPDGIHPGVYQSSPVLELLIKADAEKNRDKPYFLILDEMNLSHVERYFADFLSSMESDEEISLYEGEDRGQIPIPKTIRIPSNFFIIGTVNIDETTYQFSPKVLDRANVIEFRMDKGDVDKFFKGSTDGIVPGALAGMATQFVEDALVEDEVAVSWAAQHRVFKTEIQVLFNVLQEFTGSSDIAL